MGILDQFPNSMSLNPIDGKPMGNTAIIPTGNSNGQTKYRKLATADTNAACIKAAPGKINTFTITNLSASTKFLKILR